MIEISEFVPLINHVDYEILTTNPHTIRRKDNHYTCSEYRENNGYIKIMLNRKPYLKHRLIATQFIPNTNNLPEVDHINHDRTDNQIINLRWCSKTENNFNKTSCFGVKYEFVDDIPDKAIKILFYDTKTDHHEFEDQKYYYYCNRK